MSLSLLNLSRMPWPTDWDELFGRQAPLLIEIGFGGGQFLVDLAQRRPEYNILGIEISLPSLHRGLKKARNRNLENVRIVQGDSRAVLWLLTKPGIVHGVHINFPDPWPKAAHHNRRLINDRFLDLLATRMVEGAFLHIATDHADYAPVIEAGLLNSPDFDSTLETPFITEDNERIRTKYEDIAIEEGRTCHYFKWVRNNHPTQKKFPLLEEFDLPHVVLETPLSLEDIFNKFEPFQAPSEQVQISYLDIYRSGYGNKMMVEIFVNEDPFQQRVGLILRWRPKGDLVVGLHEIGFPRPTNGMHMAVYYFTDWLQRVSDGTTIVNSTLNEKTLELER